MEGPASTSGRTPRATRRSAEYFKKAGFASGKYEGAEKLLMVGDNEGVAGKTAEVAKENFEKMGFKIDLRHVTQDAMYTKFCNSPPAKVAICPNVGWLRDFADAQTYLDPTFNGNNILQTGNSNWSQLDDPRSTRRWTRPSCSPTRRAGPGVGRDRQDDHGAGRDRQLGLGQDPELIRSENVNAGVIAINGQWDLALPRSSSTCIRGPRHPRGGAPEPILNAPTTRHGRLHRPPPRLGHLPAVRGHPGHVHRLHGAPRRRPGGPAGRAPAVPAGSSRRSASSSVSTTRMLVQFFRYIGDILPLSAATASTSATRTSPTRRSCRRSSTACRPRCSSPPAPWCSGSASGSRSA